MLDPGAEFVHARRDAVYLPFELVDLRDIGGLLTLKAANLIVVAVVSKVKECCHRDNDHDDSSRSGNMFTCRAACFGGSQASLLFNPNSGTRLIGDADLHLVAA